MAVMWRVPSQGTSSDRTGKRHQAGGWAETQLQGQPAAFGGVRCCGHCALWLRVLVRVGLGGLKAAQRSPAESFRAERLWSVKCGHVESQEALTRLDAASLAVPFSEGPSFGDTRGPAALEPRAASPPGMAPSPWKRARSCKTWGNCLK